MLVVFKLLGVRSGVSLFVDRRIEPLGRTQPENGISRERKVSACAPAAKIY